MFSKFNSVSGDGKVKERTEQVPAQDTPVVPVETNESE